MNKYKGALLFMAGLLSVAAIGCGGSDDSGDSGANGSTRSTASSETSAPTKAEFVTAADKVCVSVENELDAMAGKLAEDTTKEEAIDVVKSDFLPMMDTKVQDLREVTPPEGDEEEITAWLDELQSGIDEVKAKPEMVFENVDPFEKADGMASEYGLKECGEKA